MKKMVIALAAMAFIGMGVAVASDYDYREGYNAAAIGNNNTCGTSGSHSDYDCNRGYLQGTADRNAAYGSKKQQ